jgi:hypothetical protein
MKRLADAACYPKNLTPRAAPNTLSFFGGSADPESSPLTPEVCVTDYMYGDGLMYPMPSFFFWQWFWAVLEIAAYCIFAGLALTAISEIVPIGFKAWWGWLNRN